MEKRKIRVIFNLSNKEKLKRELPDQQKNLKKDTKKFGKTENNGYLYTRRKRELRNPISGIKYFLTSKFSIMKKLESVKVTIKSVIHTVTVGSKVKTLVPSNFKGEGNSDGGTVISIEEHHNGTWVKLQRDDKSKVYKKAGRIFNVNGKGYASVEKYKEAILKSRIDAKAKKEDDGKTTK